MSGKRLGVGLVLAVAAVLVVLLCRQTQWNVSLRVPSYRQKGNPEARAILMEFSDFQCPNCAESQPTIKKLLEGNKEKLRIVFRHYPLNTHKWARLAAQAAETAGMQGRFWEFHDMLFEKQKEWSKVPDAKPVFLQYAAQLGLDMDRFQRELDSQRWDGLVQQDLIEGVARQVNATPTFFINERRVAGNSQLQANGARLVELALME